MAADPAPAAPSSPPNRARGRIRLVALVALVALWVLPVWAEAQVGDRVVPEVGAVRSGATAAVALLALWGLAATSLAAHTLRGLRIGAACTDAAIALAATCLLVVQHPWIPGGEIREAWVPIFGPLALLALLDAALLRWRSDAGHEVSVVRAGAALFAAGALAVDLAVIPAGIALWLGASPLLFLKLRTPLLARRSLEAFVLVAAIAVGFAPWIQKAYVGVHATVGASLTLPVYLWCIVAAVVATTALDGLLRPEGEAPARGSSA